MARFQFGKGKKKTYWDLEQFGRVLLLTKPSDRRKCCQGFACSRMSERRGYRQSVTEGNLAAMQQKHDARKNELTARYGPPIKVQPSVAGLAEAVEAALKKQLGG